MKGRVCSISLGAHKSQLCCLRFYTQGTIFYIVINLTTGREIVSADNLAEEVNLKTYLFYLYEYLSVSLFNTGIDQNLASVKQMGILAPTQLGSGFCFCRVWSLPMKIPLESFIIRFWLWKLSKVEFCWFLPKNPLVLIYFSPLSPIISVSQILECVCEMQTSSTPQTEQNLSQILEITLSAWKFWY